MTEDNERGAAAPEYNDVSVVVKWFNPKKGFGFVQADDLFDGDAFLHISVAQAAGYNHFVEGTIMTCDLQRGERGVQWSDLHGSLCLSREGSSGFIPKLGQPAGAMRGLAFLASPRLNPRAPRRAVRFQEGDAAAERRRIGQFPAVGLE